MVKRLLAWSVQRQLSAAGFMFYGVLSRLREPIKFLQRSTSSALDENACRKPVLQAAMRDQLAGARALVGAA